MDNNSVKFKKRLRLKNFNYIGRYRYYVTICTFNKEKLFLNDKVVKSLILPILEETSEKYCFKIWAYCFMPDHLHILIEGEDVASDFKKFVSIFKQISGYRYKRMYCKNLWQVNYYEHVLRSQEDSKRIANYIFDNPIRKKLVNRRCEYPFMGSYVFEM